MKKGNLLKYSAVKVKKAIVELKDTEYIQDLEVTARNIEDYSINKIFRKHIKELWGVVKS